MLTRKHLAAVGSFVVALAAFGVHTAQAAPDNVLVGSAEASACSQALVTVDYDVAYSPEAGGYAVTAAHVSGLDPTCATTVTVSLTGPNGAALLELTSPVVAATATLAIPRGTPVRAEAVSGVSVVLSG